MLTKTALPPPPAAFPPRMTVAMEVVDNVEEEEQGDVSTTTTTTTSDESQTTEEEGSTNQQQSHQAKERFERGDHVYQWCSLLGIPGVFQHHGIVLEAQDMILSGCGEEEHEQLLTIADFSNLLPCADYSSRDGRSGAYDDYSDDDDNDELLGNESEEDAVITEEDGTTTPATTRPTGSMPFLRSSGSSSCMTSSTTTTANSSSILPAKEGGCLRVYYYRSSSQKSKKKWHKVRYQDHWFHTHLWKRSGTCTPASSDPPAVVLRRVHFLVSNNTDHSNYSILPKYHSIFANCECVAVWCKTGSWSTLQAASFLSHAAVGQVKGTATIAGIAAAQTVTVPAAGIWGSSWLGYTTTVPLMSVQPLLLPAICAYGAIAIGGPAICLAVAKRKWRDTTDRLNAALDAECLKVSLMVS